MNLILASKSPRRQELLGLFGLSFTVRAADVDETMDPCMPPAQAVGEVSARKALAIPDDQALILAADTIVVCDGQILGKPCNEADAVRMLNLLSGRDHQVITGVTLRRGTRLVTQAETTHVWFRDLSQAEIAAYIATGEPMDKAGAYGIQNLGAMLVESIRGDYFTVMGLPVCQLALALKRYGIDPLSPNSEL